MQVAADPGSVVRPRLIPFSSASARTGEGLRRFSPLTLSLFSPLLLETRGVGCLLSACSSRLRARNRGTQFSARNRGRPKISSGKAPRNSFRTPHRGAKRVESSRIRLYSRKLEWDTLDFASETRLENYVRFPHSCGLSRCVIIDSFTKSNLASCR